MTESKVDSVSGLENFSEENMKGFHSCRWEFDGKIYIRVLRGKSSWDLQLYSDHFYAIWALNLARFSILWAYSEEYTELSFFSVLYLTVISFIYI